MKTILRLLPLFTLFWMMPGPAADTDSPMEVVRATSEEVFDQLRRNGELSEPELSALIQEVILPHVDLTTAARLALARHWRSATQSQRDAFLKEFRGLLIRTYATSLSEYSGEGVEYLKERREAEDRALVSTRIVRGDGPPIPVDYRLRRNGTGWQVYDIIIDGVSLVINYRNSFQQTIRREGLDALIRQLAERSA